MQDRRYTLPNMPGWTFTVDRYGNADAIWNGSAGFFYKDYMTADDIVEKARDLMQGSNLKGNDAAIDAIVQNLRLIDWKKTIAKPLPELVAFLINPPPTTDAPEMIPTELANIQKLAAAMFNAPIATHLSEILSALAVALSTTAAYKALNPDSQSPEEFAVKFLTFYGLQNNPQAVEFIVSKFNAGVNKGLIALDAVTALDSYSGTDPSILAAQAIQNNKAPSVIAEADSSTMNFTRPKIVLNLINEDQYDVAFSNGLRGDALEPLKGVYFQSFVFSLNNIEITLTPDISFQENSTNDTVTTYQQAVNAINKALDSHRAAAVNNKNPFIQGIRAALDTVRADVGERFEANVSPKAGVGLREGRSIVLSVDPTKGVPANFALGANILMGDISGLRLNKSVGGVDNSNRYEHVSAIQATQTKGN